LALPALIAGKCKINLDKVNGNFPPLLIQRGDFLFPTSRVLSFAERDELELVCHGSEMLQDKTYLKRKDAKVQESSVPLKCWRGSFRLKGSSEKINVEEASCSRKQEPRLIRSQEKCSRVGSDGRRKNLKSLVRVSIGWQLGDIFREQIGLCVDEENYGTIWTNHTVRGASISFRDIDPSRPAFRVDTSGSKRFFPWTTSSSMNSMYSKTIAKETVTDLLDGVTALEGETIIETSSSGTDYFAKGHLAPDAAFIYNVMQDATYYFVNVAPQFQSFNNGNWKALEGAVRDLGAQLGRDLEVVTGTHGILEYPDSKNKPTEIFLEKNSSYVPAPLYYWKLVRDLETDTAAVFIGLNDPHTNTSPKELCPNRCEEMGWVDWHLDDLDKGYMYCCEVEKAARKIKSIPKVKASGGLLMAGSSEATCTKNTKGIYTCPCSCKP